MNALFGLLITVLQLKIAILGCTACTPEQKEAFMATANSIEQTVNAKLTEPEAPATTTPIIVVVQQPAPTPEPVASAPAPVDNPQPEPVQFVGMPTVFASPSNGDAQVTLWWNTTASTTATISLCPKQWQCIPQGTSINGTFQLTRPASGVEWLEIRLSDTVYYRTQRPQL